MDLGDRFVNNFPRVVTEDRRGYIVLKSNHFLDDSDCWWWVGSKNEHSYGRLIYKGKRYFSPSTIKNIIKREAWERV